jgi:hypothetical protein
VAGCLSDEAPKFVDLFRKLEFDVIEEDAASHVASLVVRNHVFIAEFEAGGKEQEFAGV